ncbi:hypothetical protein R3W88_023591 [Solanum pinnatisectum]|uniref:non-specific serine/threonine protein kinase n=1 Tax=Solanum pinnatisectum TaxID=50273 RepID=A0AAV9LYS9_9SOLN|nr:hypothetical protein R3W88_023591 [Solanum pinnatisectum]
MEKLFLAMIFQFLVLLFHSPLGHAAAEDLDFTYNGFHSTNLSLDGIAEFTSDGLLRQTNASQLQEGHAFHPRPINFMNLASNGSDFSFSTTFVFAIVPEYSILAGHGMSFLIAPARMLPEALPSSYLGLFNDSSNGNATSHVVAVELDTLQNREFDDIDSNHVGIDINGLKSVIAQPAGYYTSNEKSFNNLTLASGQPMQVWVEYDSVDKHMNVTMAPLHVAKPDRPLLSLVYDISSVTDENVSIGFSASTGAVVSTHYILGWSFKMNGMAQGLDLSQLPKLPRVVPKKESKLLLLGLPVISSVSFVIAVLVIIYYIGKKMKFAELQEEWELDYGPHRFKYKDLYTATKGFSSKDLLGSGGFGRVYRGVLPISNIQIAVKRVSHESRQGMREFVSEIVSIGRLRHRNLLLLVYECMPNGSLDKYLFDKPSCSLDWNQRFRVIKGVASGLVYLHEEWEQVVIHRDIKASNVLLDVELNGRLGDFGLERLYDHGTDPQTTHIVGTLGYLAPEHTRTGKATTSTDVYSFGAFLLEVACGRRPIDQRVSDEDLVLVDYVFSCWTRGDILEAIDPNLGNNYVKEEVELVLKLGLLCSQTEPAARPNMRQVLMYLEDALPLPELSLMQTSNISLTFAGLDHFAMSWSSSVTDSLLSGGR